MKYVRNIRIQTPMLKFYLWFNMSFVMNMDYFTFYVYINQGNNFKSYFLTTD